MSEPYSAAERRALQAQLAGGETLHCPVCSAAVARRSVDPAGQVSYVRHRVLVICTGCRRSAALDER